MRDHAGHYPRAVMFRALQVSASGYYAWTGRGPSKRKQREGRLTDSVEKFHARSRKIYGYRKVHEDLVQETEHRCSAELVRRIMRRNGLRSKVKRKFVVTTDSGHSYRVAPNRLGRRFRASEQNRKWVGDITYIRTREGFLYLSVIQDLYSRRIVGWAMSDMIKSELVCDAFKMALQHRQPECGLLFHSDRGVQYAAEEYQALLSRNKVVCSMSRKGDCWDNACAENFFSRLKSEHIQDRVYATRDEARQEVFWYIEVFYNRSRRHAALGYVSPAAFEEQQGWKKAA
ncbi:IS3 family transposase [Thermodesulfobacteriota bacterium]